MKTCDGQQLLKDFPNSLTYICGDKKKQAQYVSSIEKIDKIKTAPSTLCYASTLEQIQKAVKAKAAIVISDHLVNKNNLSASFFKTVTESCILTTNNIQMAMAQLGQKYFSPPSPSKQDVSPSAVIHPSVNLPKNIFVGPYVVIDEDVTLGEYVVLKAHSHIEQKAQIGNHSIIGPQAIIGERCLVGSHCIIQSQSVIGSDGYGYAQDPQGKSHKIPHSGIVRLEDHVEIGPLSAVDRATFDETIVGEGTKTDNFCHIAHNCQIGKHNLLVSGFVAGGSTKIGDYFIAGGRVSISDHIEICDHVQVAGLSKVVKNITQPGVYGGNPLEPLKDFLRTTQNLKHLTSMRKKLRRLKTD